MVPPCKISISDIDVYQLKHLSQEIQSSPGSNTGAAEPNDDLLVQAPLTQHVTYRTREGMAEPIAMPVPGTYTTSNPSSRNQNDTSHLECSRRLS